MNVLIVDRDPLIRLGLRTAIDYDSIVVGDVDDHAVAGEQIRAGYRPIDVVVAGIAPNDLRAFSLATKEKGAPSLLLVTPRLSDALVTGAVRLGATGLMLHDSVVEHLPRAIKTVATGAPWLDPAVEEALSVLSLKGRLNGRNERGLSVQQRRVLRLLPQRLTNEEIAAELGVSLNTVKTHMRAAMAKLGVKDRVSAARIVEQEGID